MNEQHGSWLSLVMLCAVTVFSTALGFGALFAGGSAVFAVVQSPSVSNENLSEAAAQDAVSANNVSSTPVPDDQPAQAFASQPQQVSTGKDTDETDAASGKTFTGMVTDARCGARHSMKSDKTSAECARSCVRKGSRYVLVDGEEIHTLEGDSTQLDKLAGARVEVVGRLVGDTIKVEAVAAR
jgi:hypothetical protein